MDLKQNKLTRTEWDSIEVPVSDTEKEILSLIMEGFDNINIIKNKTVSLLSFVKIENTPENDKFLYDKYFAPVISRTIRKYGMNILDKWSYDFTPMKIHNGTPKGVSEIQEQQLPINEWNGTHISNIHRTKNRVSLAT